ncbi:MAG: glycoside hydrolase family 15 protein [Acidobacteriaceae bacterium]|nr:glycoside hydrolase family 15 protein [Acidobacteriaceae bacterium]
MSAAVEAYKWITDQGQAFGSPGLEPRWTSSQKDAVGTAYAASSRIWYTVSHGTLNEIYYPTIDRPQTRDMELLFTDGETYFHEEKRDFEFDFHYIDQDALAVRVVANDRDGQFTITKEIIADPHHPVVLVHVKLEGDEEHLKKLKCYALLAPHLNGGGAGNSARAIEVAGERALLAWKGGTSLAMGVSCGFRRSSCGYVGASDGYQDLCQNKVMDWEFDTALDGNIAMMGEIDVTVNREFTIAISLGEGHHSALSGLMQSLSVPFESHLKRFVEQWRRSTAPERLTKQAMDGGQLMRISHNVILAHEDKTYPGAFIASASIPWGASKGDDDLGGYHLVWTRDMVQSATAIMACGRVETARRALVYLACTQRPDGSFAQNFWIDGTPYWTGLQLDEIAFPIILGWRLWKLGGLGNFDIWPFVEAAAGCLVRYAPVTQQERWEENAGYSPSTLAAVISALVCAGDVARAHGRPKIAEFFEGYADWIESHLEDWTVTNDGVLDPEVKRHYMRIRPPMCGDPFAPVNCDTMMVHTSNRAPDERKEFDARELVDAGFLELVRYGIRRADDPLIVDSLKVVDKVLKVDTPYGPCWRRYNHDGYGQRKDGGAYEVWGQGRAWPLLTGERAHYELAAGRDVSAYIKAMEGFSSFGRMLPEQIWDCADMPEWGLYMGRSAGSAQPLVWAHSEYVKLLRSVADGRVFDRISVVEERYCAKVSERKNYNKVEVFQLTRKITAMAADRTLYVLDPAAFELVWSVDGWQTTQRTQATELGLAGFNVQVPKEATERAERIVFTMHWPAEDRWAGTNFEVVVQKTA